MIRTIINITIGECNRRSLVRLSALSLSSLIVVHRRSCSNAAAVSDVKVSELIKIRKEKELKLRAECDILPTIDVRPLGEVTESGSYVLMKKEPIAVHKLKYLLVCMDFYNFKLSKIRKVISKAINSGDDKHCFNVLSKLLGLIGTRSDISGLMTVFRRKFAAAVSVPYGSADALWTPREGESILKQEAEVVRANKDDNLLLMDDVKRRTFNSYELLAIRERMVERANRLRGVRGQIKSFTFESLDKAQADAGADFSFEYTLDNEYSKLKAFRSIFVQNLKAALIQEVQKLHKDELTGCTITDLFVKINDNLQDMLPKE